MEIISRGKRSSGLVYDTFRVSGREYVQYRPDSNSNHLPKPHNTWFPIKDPHELKLVNSVARVLFR